MKTVTARDLIKLSRDGRANREEVREALEVGPEEKQVAVLESMKEAMDRTSDIMASGVSVQQNSNDKLAMLLAHMLNEFSKKNPAITEWTFDIQRDIHGRSERIYARAGKCE